VEFAASLMTLRVGGSQVPLLYHEQMSHFHKFVMKNKALFPQPEQAALPDNGGNPALNADTPGCIEKEELDIF